jgi:hypothetical protein
MLDIPIFSQITRFEEKFIEFGQPLNEAIKIEELDKEYRAIYEKFFAHGSDSELNVPDKIYNKITDHYRSAEHKCSLFSQWEC